MQSFYFLICLAVHNAYASDPSRFLLKPDIQVTQVQGKAQIFPGGHDEKYFAEDSYGNRYKLRLKNALPNYAEIGVSILMEASGLPVLPVYPIIVRRGEQGIPSSQQAKALDPENSFLGLSGGHGEYFPATIQPLGEIIPINWGNLPAKQAAELVLNLLFNYIVGNHDIQLTHNIVLIKGADGEGHFATIDATQAFKFVEKGETLDYFLSLIPRHALRSAFTEREFYIVINEVLSRLEKVNAADLGKIFGPYIRGSNSLRRSKGSTDFDFIGNLQFKINHLRSSLLNVLSKQGATDEHLSFLQTPIAKISNPVITVPTATLHSNNVPKANEPTVGLLWSYYFQDFWKVRAAAETAWKNEMGGTTDAILELRKRMAQETSVVHVGSGFDFSKLSSLTQLNINRKNSSLLLVVPVNDQEALTIVDIGKASGAHVLPLQLDHGSKLTEDIKKQILKKATEIGANTIAIVELPGTSKVEEDIRASGKDLIVIDHHDYQDMKRANPLSSLEQVANLLGFNLSSNEMAVAINDRSFIYGLRDLGLSQPDLEGFLSKSSANFMKNTEASLAAINKYSKIIKVPTEKQVEKVYVLSANLGKIGEIAGALAIQEYPHSVNVLVLTNDLRFSGNPEIKDRLKSAFGQLEGKQIFGAHYSGGDPQRSVFWGVKEIKETNSLPGLYKIALEAISQRSILKEEFDEIMAPQAILRQQALKRTCNLFD